MMRLLLLFLTFSTFSTASWSSNHHEKTKIERAVRDYIESQHTVNSNMMARGIDSELAKRTYWRSKDNNEIIMETSSQDMIKLAGFYNKNADQFPASPKVDIKIFDIDQRVASVKLLTDDWIDYMHLYKNDAGEWKILNVLWQFNDVTAHSSKK